MHHLGHIPFQQKLQNSACTIRFFFMAGILMDSKPDTFKFAIIALKARASCHPDSKVKPQIAPNFTFVGISHCSTAAVHRRAGSKPARRFQMIVAGSLVANTANGGKIRCLWLVIAIFGRMRAVSSVQKRRCGMKHVQHPESLVPPCRSNRNPTEPDVWSRLNCIPAAFGF